MSQLLEPVILAVDADPAALALIATLLEGNGCRVFTSRDITEAIAIAKENIIDLLICDMQVHSHSGLEIVGEIRKLPLRDDVPCLYTSAVQTPDVIHRRHQSGSAFHLKKPFDHEVFIEIVERALWMPHLVQSHIQAIHNEEELAQPHFPIGSVGLPVDSKPIIPASSHTHPR